MKYGQKVCSIRTLLKIGLIEKNNEISFYVGLGSLFRVMPACKGEGNQKPIMKTYLEILGSILQALCVRLCRIKYVFSWSIIVTTLVTASNCNFAMPISVIFTV